ncbi:Solute carrier 2, facilitated glucose transporter member 1 [Phlyctochytrium planicorne]|nr:Solute carrier 2, facilitated glucose transporter member 1 [Phlyctochytrium planicorne]
MTTTTLSLSILTAALTAFQFGYHAGVINQPRNAMTNCDTLTIVESGSLPQCIPMDDWEWGAFVSLFLLGGILGGLSGGYLSQTFGRRKLILYNNFTFILSGILLGFAPSVNQLCFGRFVAGIGAGIGTVVVPMYISEISPVDKRGTYGSLNQLSIVVGVLFSQTAGVALSTPELWRLLLSLTLAPSIILMLVLPYAVESPKWLAGRGQTYDARKALSLLRIKMVDEELAEMTNLSKDDEDTTRNEEEDAEGFRAATLGNNLSSANLLLGKPPAAEAKVKNIKWMDLWNVRAIRKPVMAAFALQIIQQFSGINAAVYYSTTIFEQSYDPDTAIQLTLLVSVVQLIMTLVSTVLVEKLGRRTLLLAAESGMAASAFAIIFSVKANLGASMVVASLMTFVGAFGLGLGAIPWLIIPELIPSYAIGPASSICTAINWSSSFGLALIFPMLIRGMGYDVFFLFGLILCSGFAFTYTNVPETKGLTPEQVATINHYV